MRGRSTRTVARWKRWAVGAMATFTIVAHAHRASAQWRTPWEMNPGEGIVPFPSVMMGNGNPAEYAFATVPAATDPRWVAAPDPRRIEYMVRSTICDSGLPCSGGADFTYFRSTVCLPTTGAIRSLIFGLVTVDDGVRISVVNSRFPTGTTPPGAFAALFGGVYASPDLVSLLAPGERNEILVTHVDDCCEQAYLRGVSLLADGVELPFGVQSETCNGIDDDCNGHIDDGLGQSTCGIGNCMRTTDNCINGALATCTPGPPSPEVCDSFDNDCNGAVDEGLGMTECGIGACHNVVPNCAHGFPVTCTPGPPRAEICNGIDDDCDGIADNDCREAGPEPAVDSGVDVTEGFDGAVATTCGGDPRCNRAVRISGRAGPWGCACSTQPSQASHHAAWFLRALIGFAVARRRRASREN